MFAQIFLGVSQCRTGVNSGVVVQIVGCSLSLLNAGGCCIHGKCLLMKLQSGNKLPNPNCIGWPHPNLPLIINHVNMTHTHNAISAVTSNYCGYLTNLHVRHLEFFDLGCPSTFSISYFHLTLSSQLAFKRQAYI